MSLCLLVGATVLSLAAPSFTLEWEHSVEKTRWRESWHVETGRLVLAEAAVKGSGAGMEPGEGARLVDDWWIWAPDLPPQERLVLAASGATREGWTLCNARDCRIIGRASGKPVTIRVCDGN